MNHRYNKHASMVARVGGHGTEWPWYTGLQIVTMVTYSTCWLSLITTHSTNWKVVPCLRTCENEMDHMTVWCGSHDGSHDCMHVGPVHGFSISNVNDL